jgi:hypothetical protein
MAEDKFYSLIRLLTRYKPPKSLEQLPMCTTTMAMGARAVYSSLYPAHECVDRPELPCPACEAAQRSPIAA